MTKREQERQNAIEHLRTIIKPGDTVYTVLRHVSRSGMLRTVDVYIMQDNQPHRITWEAGKATGIDYDRNREALKLGGCGYNVGFHVVYALGHALLPEFRCIGENCPSNDHFNYRSVIQCHGGEDAAGEHQPCFADDAGLYRLRTGVGDEFALGDVCPTCKGKGKYPNKKPEPKKGDLHSDGGYSLRHKWM